MIPLKSFGWANIRNFDRQRVSNASHIYRQFSSVSARICTEQKRQPHLPPWCLSSFLTKQSLNVLSKRYASTGIQSSTTVDLSTSSFAQEPIAASPPDTFVPSSLDSITAAEYPRAEEHIGFLKELGLDYGFGPTAFVQSLLEHVHIYTGTPWWGSIILTAFLVRLVLLKAYIDAADVTARIATLNPHIASIKAKIKVARDARQDDEMRRHTLELRDLFKSTNVQPWRLFVPMLQIPLGFGTFRLLRGMADLPVPGLDSGGLLWLKDLTVSDPYLILPIMTGLAFHVTFLRGGELGSSPMMNPVWRTTFLYGLPILTTSFMLFWPGSLQLTFAFTSILSLTQSYLLRQPWMRNFLGIQPLPVRAPPTSYAGVINRYEPPSPTSSSSPANKGILGGAISDIKGAASEVVKTARSFKDSQETKTGTRRRTPAELRRAKAYEEKRQREIAQAKLEASTRGKRIWKG